MTTTTSHRIDEAGIDRQRPASTSVWSVVTPIRSAQHGRELRYFSGYAGFRAKHRRHPPVLHARHGASALFGGNFEQTLGAAYSKYQIRRHERGWAAERILRRSPQARLAGQRKAGNDEILVLGAEHQKDEITNPISASTAIDAGYAELQSAFARDFFQPVSVRYGP